MKLGNFFRRFDNYGYKIHLNFKRQGEEVKTNIGGFFSLLISLFIISYAGLKLSIMIGYQATLSSLESTMTDSQLQDLIDVPFSDTKVLLYYRLVGAGQRNLQQPIPFDETFFQYLNGFNMKVNILNDKKQFVDATTKFFRKCNRQDFENIRAGKFYDNKYGGTLICADNANILLNATNDDTTNSVLNYMITTCDYQQNLNAKINLQCKSYEEVQQYLKDFMLEMRIIYQQIDFNQYNQLPIQTRDKFLMYITLDQTKTQVIEIPIRKNYVTLTDSFVNLGINQDVTFSFYDIDDKQLNKFDVVSVPAYYGSFVLVNKLQLTKQMITHSRRVYGIFDILGELAGLNDVFQYLFKLILTPLSQFTFYYQAIMKLFKYKNSHNLQIFNVSKKQSKDLQKISIFQDQLKTKEIENTQNNIRIRFSFRQKFNLYLYYIFGGIFECCFKKKNEIIQIFKKGLNQLEKEMNIVKILRNVRNLKLYNQMSGYKEAMKLKIKNQGINVIDISQSEQENKTIKQKKDLKLNLQDRDSNFYISKSSIQFINTSQNKITPIQNSQRQQFSLNRKNQPLHVNQDFEGNILSSENNFSKQKQKENRNDSFIYYDSNIYDQIQEYDSHAKTLHKKNIQKKQIPAQHFQKQNKQIQIQKK